MSRTAHLRIPFFDAQHRAFADELDQWTHEAVGEVEGGDAAHGDVDAICVRWVRALAPPGGSSTAFPLAMAAPMTRCGRSIWSWRAKRWRVAAVWRISRS